MILARFFFTELNDKNYHWNGRSSRSKRSKTWISTCFSKRQGLTEAIPAGGGKLPVRKAFGWANVPRLAHSDTQSAEKTFSLRRERGVIPGTCSVK